MQYWIVSSKFITRRLFTGGVVGMLMIMVTSAIAGNSTFGSNNSQYNNAQYYVQRVAEQTNPWLLPSTPKSHPGFQSGAQQPLYEYYPQYQSAPQAGHYSGAQNSKTQSWLNTNRQSRDRQSQNRDRSRPYQPVHQWQSQTERFVTPGHLESLKQQQKQYQIVPENEPYQQSVPGKFMQMPPQSGAPGSGINAYPSYGMGSANPLYDTPAVSPWGDGADVLYRGESFPLVPSEALGGLSPMYTPSFGMGNYKRSEFGNPVKTDESNVFNPFTFLPKGSLP